MVACEITRIWWKSPRWSFINLVMCIGEWEAYGVFIRWNETCCSCKKMKENFIEAHHVRKTNYIVCYFCKRQWINEIEEGSLCFLRLATMWSRGESPPWVTMDKTKRGALPSREPNEDRLQIHIWEEALGYNTSRGEEICEMSQQDYCINSITKEWVDLPLGLLISMALKGILCCI